MAELSLSRFQYSKDSFFYIVLIVVAIFLAVAIALQPRFRFGLRDLFVLTTVVALLIGTMAYWQR